MTHPKPTREWVDVSSAQGPATNFDYGKYYRGGHLLAGNKLSQATDYVNPDWHGHTVAAHEHHISVLNYHFASTGDPVGQANYFLDHLAASKVYKPEYDRVCLDLEAGSKVEHPVTFLNAFEGRLIERGHTSMWLYCPVEYLIKYGEKILPKSRKLWVPAYPDLAEGWWTEYVVAHQRTDRAHIGAYAGPLDASRILSDELYQHLQAERP